MYRSAEAHHMDCKRYAFEDIPGRVFLDTNVVNLVVKHAATIFEMQPIPTPLTLGRRQDIEALLHIFAIGQRAHWQLMASSKTLEELQRTLDDQTRSYLVDYALQLIDPANDDHQHANRLGRRLTNSSLLGALPDAADRELLGNAIGLGCDAFVTSDVRTIVSKRESLPKLPLKILTPVEWWAHVKPWGGLWC